MSISDILAAITGLIIGVLAFIVLPMWSNHRCHESVFLKPSCPHHEKAQP